ncbi:tRNA glutamyl-Q(34) synthetase GluQRS [Paracoccaceae bacterium]|nr:tRNA glutamyl-Q(34) synthetase GluQRS [Paracoccaceae bacterium]
MPSLPKGCVTRFAPSPTGPLHLGHAYSACLAHDMARKAQGQFLLRIEDIDQSRARPQWEAQIYDDLAWLGLSWPLPVMRQSKQMARYRAALDQLAQHGLIYRCTCRRRDIEAASAAPQEGAPTFGPDGRIYPGTCRGQTVTSAAEAQGAALRLDLARAFERLAQTRFTETGPRYKGRHEITRDAALAHIGDPVLARPDMGSSYHLSVVVDDAAQGVTHVIRGEDLFEATAIHVILQNLLAYPVPQYHHHALIRDEQGKRLAKRDDARAIALYRDAGKTPTDIRAMVGL